MDCAGAMATAPSRTIPLTYLARPILIVFISPSDLQPSTPNRVWHSALCTLNSSLLPTLNPQPVILSHLQTIPAAWSTLSPALEKPHFLRMCVDAFSVGSVCARTTRTRASADAKADRRLAASVAYPRPR